MKRFFKPIIRMFAGVFSVAVLSGCTSLDNNVSGPTSRRDPGRENPFAELGQPLVVDWFAACDIIARDLTLASVFQYAQEPKVVEIRPIENQTGRALDCKIYSETIRAKIIGNGNRMIAFRDEMADQIIEERVNQSDEPLIVTQTQVIGRQERQSSGPPSEGRLMETRDYANTIQGERKTQVSTKVANVDYFLNGKAYAQSEPLGGAQNSGSRYYQFQFRLTDAHTRLIVWEKYYRVMREGDLAPILR